MEFKLVKTSHNSFTEYVKANRQAGYFFKNTYTEISKDDYWYMLEVLPPAKMSGSAFLMSERNYEFLTNGAFTFSNSLKESPEGKFYIFTIDSRQWKEAINWIKENKDILK